jgi:ABC-type amino acid transport substrate-binding protein
MVVAQEQSQFERGRLQFARTCAQCHGHNMVNSGVTVYDLRKFPLDQEERFFHSVRHGKGNMPSWDGSLSDDQIHALWTYVRNRGQEPTPLRVCAAENNPPLSQKVRRQARGLDIAVAQAIARDMGRSLEVVFFESEYEADKSLAQEVNALLSSEVCELASGFPLFASDLGAPARATARTPDYEGAKPRRLRPFITLRSIAASRSYYAMAMGVVTRDPNVAVDSLADLQKLKVGAVSGTLAGSALMLYRNGLLQPSIVTLAQRENALEALAAGRFDATLVALTSYDAYRLAHPEARLFRAKFVHPLRINLGLVALEDAPALAAASRVIERSLASGELAKWAEEAGVTWIAPQPPDVNPPFSLFSLRAD